MYNIYVCVRMSSARMHPYGAPSLSNPLNPQHATNRTVNDRQSITAATRTAAYGLYIYSPLAAGPDGVSAKEDPQVGVGREGSL